MTISVGAAPEGSNDNPNPETKTVVLSAGEPVRVRFELRRRDKEK
jgi:hypothetical protein